MGPQSLFPTKASFIVEKTISESNPPSSQFGLLSTYPAGNSLPLSSINLPNNAKSGAFTQFISIHTHAQPEVRGNLIYTCDSNLPVEEVTPTGIQFGLDHPGLGMIYTECSYAASNIL
jgi:hypothetical protein